MKRFAAFAFLLSFTLPAIAGISDGINQIRSRGCDSKAGIKTRLKPSKGLDEVAREWSKGGRLAEAIDRTKYRSANSASMNVEGTTDDQAILDVLSERYCDNIVNASFTEIGVFRRGNSIWVVVAKPLTMPSSKEARRVSARVLALVNEARSKARKCGSRSYEAAPPLQLSPQLGDAALTHAQDMSKNNFLEHRGSDGSMPADRVSRTGYRWRAVAENIAAGIPDADAVVRGWLNSPGHCSNIMGAQFREMGVAYVVNDKKEPTIHWAQEFAMPVP